MSGPLDYTSSRMMVSVLCCGGNSSVLMQLKHALKTIGFSALSSAQSHVQGVDRFRERHFTLVIFDAKSTDMPSEEFVKQVIKMDRDAVLVPFSSEPRVDDVFGLLRAGSRHYLSVPFDAQTVEDVVVKAFNGPPLSERILESVDRNAALAGLVLNCLYRVSVLQRQVREYPRWKALLEREQAFLSEATHLARLFCEGSEAALQERIMESCVARAEMASTRIGRTRVRLRNQRENRAAQQNTQQQMVQAVAAVAARRS